MHFWTIVPVIGVVALLKDSSCSPDPFQTENTNLTAKVGSCIKINCTSIDLLRDSAEWFWIKDALWNRSGRFEGTVVYSKNIKTRRAYQGFGDRVQFDSADAKSCGILISNLRKGDSGNYQFRYIGSDLVWMTKPAVKLQVVDNPCPVYLQNVQPVRESDRVTLHCSTSSLCSSDLEFSKFQEDTRFDTKNHTGQFFKSLSISFNVDWRDNQRVLSCQTRGDKCLSQTVTLNVQHRPRETVVTKSPTIIRKGAQVTLTCSAKANPPPTFTWFGGTPEFRWYRQGSGNKLKLNTIWPSDNRQYHCQASNILGTEKSNSIDVAVQYAATRAVITPDKDPGQVKEGDDLKLTCATDDGNPAPTFRWYKDGETLQTFQKELDLKGIRPSDKGTYRCEAVNVVGASVSRPLYFNVQYSPKNTMIHSSNQREVKVNTDITLTCNTDAEPPAEHFNWYHRSERAGPSHWMVTKTSWRTLYRVKATDDGCYCCSAENSMGNGMNSSIMCIRVLYPPTKPVISMDTEASESDVITIGCSVDSFPASTLTLTFIESRTQTTAQCGNGLVSNSQNFSVTVTSSGFYTCCATNAEGTSSTEQKLMVRCSPKDVSVHAQPGTIVDEGKRLELQCLTTSYPPVSSYIWTKTTAGGAEVVGTDRNFIVNSVAPSHSGMYSCAASNAMGTGNSSSMEVKVRYAPQHTEIVRNSSGSQSHTRRPVLLSCHSLSFPAPVSYKWFRTFKNTSEDQAVLVNQNFTVRPDEPGLYYCVASNGIGSKASDPIALFLDPTGGQTQTFPVILGCVSALLVLLLIGVIVGHKRNKLNRQGPSHTLPFLNQVAYLGQLNDTGENLDSRGGLAEPCSSRDDLLPGYSFQPDCPLCPAYPDSTSDSNIIAVSCTLNPPSGAQLRPPREPIASRDGQTADDNVEYSSLYFGNQIEKKHGWNPRANVGENDIYARIDKPQERLQEYENIEGERVPTYPTPANSDTENSAEDIELNYARVSFKVKPEQRALYGPRQPRHDPEEDPATQYANIR